MRLRYLPVLIIMLGLSVLPGMAQSRRRSVFTIQGFVRDQTNQQPMENIPVGLKQSTGTPVTTTYTRVNGEFEFGGLPSGDYAIEINVRDYEPVREIVSISNTSQPIVSIFLSRTSKTATPVFGATISAHQLSVPHKARDEFEKGVTLVMLKSDYRGGIAAFERAIKDFPTYYEAYAEEGNAYYLLNEMGPAEEALRKSIELSSGQYADALFTLAAVLTDAKRFPEAETLARQGIKEESSSWRGSFELARALNGLKKPEEAEKNAIQSRDLMPDNPAVYLLLANIHIQRRDIHALQSDLEQYLRVAPNGPEADQARKTLERVQGIINSEKTNPDDRDDEDDQDSNGKNAHPAPAKAPAPPAEPDTSGLPSLPPPSAANP
jgi:carboxypeptidase family protein/tetratricopeptide repeat protein